MDNGFSIVLVSWNNLDFLKNAIHSIQEHSIYGHEILIHVNEGTDGTLDWVSEQGYSFTYSEDNIGLLKAANGIAKAARKDYIYHMDDDMYVLPGWDSELIKFHREHKLGDNFWLNSTMIESMPGPAWTITPKKYGRDISSFDEAGLMADYHKFSGVIEKYRSTAMPVLIPRAVWEAVGGFAEEFSPAIGNEEGFAKKVYDNGCRDFVGVPKSLVYHFQCNSTSRLSNRGQHSVNRESIFQELHGISCGEFNKNIIQRGTIWTND